MSCKICHVSGTLQGDVALTRPAPVLPERPSRDSIPPRNDSRILTVRNTPPLHDSLVPDQPHLFHFDGEFATPEALVKETFLGRNHGWLPAERTEAIRHFARVIREDTGTRADAPTLEQRSYSILLRGTDQTIPPELRLPESFRVDPATATDDEIVDACARLVAAYLRTLQFSRDADGLHNGSPYDAFLAVNRLPRAPKPDQNPADYSRLLGEQVALLRAPRWVDDPDRRLRSHDGQPFRFGELELQGMRIFFRSAIGSGQKSGAGNCAECHVPPRFTDFKFHNTGAAQDEYDGIHGAGSFSRIPLPDVATREADFDRWLPPTTRHPHAAGPFRSVPDANHPGRTDLGMWNVYGNPDLPEPQPAMTRLMNPAGTHTRDQVLALTVGRFKTSTVRNLGHSAPYLHTGQLRSTEDVVLFYQRMGELARSGRMRNAPPEYYTMRLGTEDIAPLSAFMRALNEDFADPLAGAQSRAP